MIIAPAIAAALLASTARAAPMAPESFLGHPVAADGRLFKWDAVVRYARHVAEESPRIRVMEVGKSTRGRPFLLVAAGDPPVLSDLDGQRERLRRLADPRKTTAAEAARIAREAKVVVLFTLNVHSIEIGASQESVELLYEMATREDPRMQVIRDNVLLLIIPSMNPDGMDIVVDWYEKTRGTPAEGTGPVELYHPYAGHDNNRDGFFNNLVETSHLSRVMYHDWRPQLILDQHQMGTAGPRLFLPPFDDPISETVHPLVYSQLSACSQQMVSDLHAAGWRGIVTRDRFTAEWPGSIRSTGFWHNVLGILSEVASVRIATPIYFPPGSLTPGGRGLPEYERRSNFLDPWPGGWWTLRNIVDIEKDLSWSLLRWCAAHREELLLNFHRMNADAVKKGRTEPPYGFVWSLDGQHDPAAGWRLADILMAGGVEVTRVEGPVTLEGRRHEGDVAVVGAGQPFRPFILEMTGQAPYPTVRESADGPLVAPYDVTAWSLPDFLGVDVQVLNAGPPPEGDGLLLGALQPARPDSGWRPLKNDFEARKNGRPAAWSMSPRANRSFTAALRLLRSGFNVRRAGGPTLGLSEPPRKDTSWVEPGTWIVEAPPGMSDPEGRLGRAIEGAGLIVRSIDDRPGGLVKEPRIGVYSPWGGSMDEGWTRLILDRYEFRYTTIHNQDLRGPADPKDKDLGPAPPPLRDRFDVVVFPDISASTLEKGEHPRVPANMYSPLWPEEYRGGLGKERTIERLREFTNDGGTILAFDGSCDYLIEHLGLPARSVLRDVPRKEFDAPGTLVRLEVDPREPVAFGMPRETAAWFAGSRAFEPIGWSRPTGVPARYATNPDELKIAGYLHGADRLAGKAAVLDIPMGKGRVILIGFRPQNRAQTEATFKFVFNALMAGPEAR